MSGSAWTIEELELLNRILAGELSAEEREQVLKDVEARRGAIAAEVRRLEEADLSPLATIERVFAARHADRRGTMERSSGDPLSKEQAIWKVLPAVLSSSPGPRDREAAAALLALALLRTGHLRYGSGRRRGSGGLAVVEEAETLRRSFASRGSITLRGDGVYVAITAGEDPRLELRLGVSPAEALTHVVVEFCSGNTVVLRADAANGRMPLTAAQVFSMAEQGVDRIVIRNAKD